MNNVYNVYIVKIENHRIKKVSSKVSDARRTYILLSAINDRKCRFTYNGLNLEVEYVKIERGDAKK